MILYESFEDALKQDIDFNTNHAILHFLVAHPRTCDRPVSAYNIGGWASTLASTSTIVSDDVGFVLNKRLNELEKEYRTKELGPDMWYLEGLRALGSVAEADQALKERGLHNSSVIATMQGFR